MHERPFDGDVPLICGTQLACVGRSAVDQLLSMDENTTRIFSSDSTLVLASGAVVDDSLEDELAQYYDYGDGDGWDFADVFVDLQVDARASLSRDINATGELCC